MSIRIAAVAGLSVAALAACTPADGATGIDQTGGDVVIAVSTSRSGEHTEHLVECGADPTAEFGDYQVLVPAEVAYTIPEGAPCPVGPREPMPQDEYPELYAEFSEAVNEPMPYEGGDLDTCGTWGTTNRDEARRLAVECGPLTRGDLG